MIKKRRHRRQESTEQAEYAEFAYVWIPSSTTTWVQNDGTEETRNENKNREYEKSCLKSTNDEPASSTHTKGGRNVDSDLFFSRIE